MKFRNAGKAAPVTPGQLLPALILIAVGLSVLACRLVYVWGNLNG